MSEVVPNVSKITESYEDFLKERVSFDEFYVILMHFLNEHRQYWNSPSKSDASSIDEIRVDIKDKFTSYKRYFNIGNEQVWRNELKEAELVAGKLVGILEQMMDNSSDNTTDLDPIPERNAVKPEINDDDLKLTDDDWSIFVRSIRAGECVPFVGSDTFSPWMATNGIQSTGWTKSLSEQWTIKYEYPFSDSSQLSRVAQFIALETGNLSLPKLMLSDMCKAIETPDFSQTEFNDNPYALLADLNLAIYITTNFDHFLEAALVSRDKNKRPVTEVCRWSGKVREQLKRAGMESIFRKGSKYKPYPNAPLVYHLHGDMESYQSMVLTEKDYIDFIMNLSIEGDKAILPKPLTSKLATSSLLFIGYDLEEINFRIIFQCFLALQADDFRMTSIAVQLPPRLSPEKEKKALKYLREYTKGMNVRVYWGSSHDFCKELRRRLFL